MKQISNPGVLCSVMATAAQLATARTTWAHGPDAVSANQEMPSRKAACVTGILWAHGPEISSIRRSVQAQILLGFLPDFHGEFGCVTFFQGKTSLRISHGHENRHQKCLPLRGRKTNITVGPERLLQDQQRTCVLAAWNVAGRTLQIRSQTKHVSSIDQTWNGFKIWRQKKYEAGDQVEQISLRMVSEYGPWHIFLSFVQQIQHGSNQDTNNNEQDGSS